jgi:hypothetical protein
MMTTERHVDGVSGTEATLYRTVRGAGGRERARAGSAPRPHAPAAARQGQATAEDEPRRRPRGAARPSYMNS